MDSRIILSDGLTEPSEPDSTRIVKKVSVLTYVLNSAFVDYQGITPDIENH
jgi:hypothetical protein